MNVFDKKMIAALVVSFGLPTMSALADGHLKTEQDQRIERFNLEAVTCWEVITLPEEGEADALLLLYGYDAGKGGKSRLSAMMIEQALLNTVDYCEEHPDTSALKAISLAQ